MRYTGTRRITRFLKLHPELTYAFACWLQTLLHVNWKTSEDISRTFRNCTICDRIFVVTLGNKCKVAAGTFWESWETHECDVRVLKILTTDEYAHEVGLGHDPFARQKLAQPITGNKVLRAIRKLGSWIVDDERSLDLADDLADAHYTDPAATEFEAKRETFSITVLIEEYETDTYPPPILIIQPAERLKFILDMNGMNVIDLKELLDCSEFEAAESLQANRVLTQGQLLKLSEHFCLRPSFFGSANYLV